jgi:6-phosphogluconolactonase/glucosamine-6-phosphate isomerase/deaminase
MSVIFVKTSDTKRCETAIAKSLQTALTAYNRVLFIVPGGSNIPIVTRIMQHITASDSVKLAIMLSDERFGDVGHPDSNLQQLYESGFKPKHATIVPVLRQGASLEETGRLYAKVVSVAFNAADTIIAFLGMGADGHIAGILPDSIATKPSKKWVVGYKTPEFTRITMTPFALAHVSKAFVVAAGTPKLQALQSLQKKVQSVAKQPVQLLKQLPEATVFNDQIGDKL